jgi:hypothetical protein
MNERIRELLNKASQYAYEQNPGENSYGRPVDEHKYNQDRDTKFAELMIEECRNVLTDLYRKTSLELCGPLLTLDEEIVKHFYGVEE